jgi:hypothetical protein
MKLKQHSTSITSKKFLLELYTVKPMCMFLHWPECCTFTKNKWGKTEEKHIPQKRDKYYKCNKEIEKNKQ